jgi:Zn finger protein HypA/HybF involved in hydrogenase expression
MLGEGCHQCHNPNGWAIWDFDHAEQTRFALDDGHGNLRCNQCHNKPSPADLKLSMQCNTCHRQDDTHNGQFGSDCSRCHTTKDFRDVHISY